VQHFYVIDVSQAEQRKITFWIFSKQQHAKRDEEYDWKRILNFNNMQIFLLATNACNYLLYEACNKNKTQQTKHFRQLNQTIWLVCYHMIIGDRSIDNSLRGFHSFTNLSSSEYRHKSKMIMLLRDEKSGIKSGNIIVHRNRIQRKKSVVEPIA
jgi:hypothetical protein